MLVLRISASIDIDVSLGAIVILAELEDTYW